IQACPRAEQLMLTDVELNDLYGVIEQAGKKAARLVDDLLDLDRLRRGQLEPGRGPTDGGAPAGCLGDAPPPERGARDLGRPRDLLANALPSLSGHPVRIDSERGLLVDVDNAKVERIV